MNTKYIVFLSLCLPGCSLLEGETLEQACEKGLTACAVLDAACLSPDIADKPICTERGKICDPLKELCGEAAPKAKVNAPASMRLGK